MAQAIDAADYVLDHLGDDDRFAIVDFSRYVRTFDEELRPASDAEAGIDYVRDIEPAATRTSRAPSSGHGAPRRRAPGTVIFLTDGLPTVGIEYADGILDAHRRAAAPERTQLFAFGVGYDVDTVLLDALASSFVGSSHYVPPRRTSTPRSRGSTSRSRRPSSPTSRSASTASTRTTSRPSELPGIFAGNQALLTGRYEGAGHRDGHRDAAIPRRVPRSFDYDVDFPERDGRATRPSPSSGRSAASPTCSPSCASRAPRLAHRGDRRHRQPVRHRHPLHRVPRRGAGAGLRPRRGAADGRRGRSCRSVER